MTQEADDHLPPPREPRKAPAEAKGTPVTAAPSGRPSLWGDRILFAALGLLVGFTAAYLYLEKAGPGPAQDARVDPHAGVPGMGPGATRDLPGAGGGAPRISADPAVRQKLQELEEAVAKSPNDYNLLVQLGNAAYDAEDSRQAVGAYERALKIKADDANVLTDLGVSYRNLGDVAKALECFQKARTIDPKHGPSLFNQAVVYGIDKGDVAKARELLAELKKEHPEIPGLDKLDQSFEAKPK